MKRKSIVQIVIIFLIVLTQLCSCDPPFPYTGEYMDLCTEAINSVLDFYGYGPTGTSPDLTVVEVDSYGRKMYIYDEYSSFGVALLISQGSDDDNVYYYADRNFILAKYEDIVKDDGGNIDVIASFGAEKISELKDKNDWEAELDFSKCTKKGIISVKKRKLPRVSNKNERIINDLCYKLVLNTGYTCEYFSYRYYRYSTTDANGKKLYYAYAYDHKADGENEEFNFAFIINEDGSINENAAVILIDDIYNYQDQLKEFKARNGWEETK